MYVLLSGAKCNLGDFLITERAVALLRALRPDRELRVLPSWQPLDLDADAIRKARAILIAGGPGYQPDLYPDVYPLTERLDDLPCPVIPLGVGWKGLAGDAYAVASYRFSDRSLQALRWMCGRTESLGCRDPLTLDVLRRHGFESVTMVGCPVWYDLPSIGREPELGASVDRVVFTPAQTHELEAQSIEVARRIAAVWPRADRICSFHRGVDGAGPWLPEADLAINRRIAAAVAGLGFEVVDVTGDTAKIRFYDTCSLHVGYRVHAHLYFLSQRRPSLLIEEDGRGAGMSRALGVAGITAFRAARVAQRLPGPLLRALARPYRVRSDVPAAVERRLRQDAATGFSRYAELGRTLDAHYATMAEFVRRLP